MARTSERVARESGLRSPRITAEPYVTPQAGTPLVETVTTVPSVAGAPPEHEQEQERVSTGAVARRLARIPLTKKRSKRLAAEAARAAAIAPYGALTPFVSKTGTVDIAKMTSELGSEETAKKLNELGYAVTPKVVEAVVSGGNVPGMTSTDRALLARLAGLSPFDTVAYVTGGNLEKRESVKDELPSDLKEWYGDSLSAVTVSSAASALWPEAPTRRRRAPSIDIGARAAYLGTLGFSSSELAQYVKDAGGARSRGETGHILGSIVSDPTLLSSGLRAWYDREVAATAKVLEEAKKRVQRNIAKLKASGEDYERSDIIRIYKNAYPKWSSQYKRKAKELPKRLHYEAKIAARRVERALRIPGEEITEITIGATDEELAKVLADQETGRGCPATVNTYKVRLKDGSVVLVNALQSGSDMETGQDAAIAKAEAAGYNVAWATKKMNWEKVYAPSRLPTITVGLYEVVNDGGKKIKIHAPYEAPVSTVLAIADAYGLQGDPGSFRITSRSKARVTTDKASQLLSNAESTSSRLYGLMYMTISPVFGADNVIPSDSIPIRTGPAKTDIGFLTPGNAAFIRETTFYRDAKGLDYARLGSALKFMYALQEKAPKIDLPGGWSMPLETIRDAAGRVLWWGWDSVPKETRDRILEGPAQEAQVVSEEEAASWSSVIYATQEERDREAASKATRTGCPALIITYVVRVQLDGASREVFVQAFSTAEAKAKAKEAGYKVTSAAKLMGTDEEVASKTAEQAKVDLGFRPVPVIEPTVGPLDQAEFDEQLKNKPVFLREAYATGGLTAYNVAIQALKDTYVELADGSWLSKETWNTLPPRLQTMGLSVGATAIHDAIEQAETSCDRMKEDGFASESEEWEPGDSEQERWNYDIHGALEAGYDARELEVLFGVAAVKQAQDRIAAGKKLERIGGSPTWALINNMVTPEEVTLLFGEEDAAPFLAAKTAWDEAQTTKREAAWYDVPARTGATLATVQQLTAGAGEYLGTKYLLPLKDKAEELVPTIPDAGVWGNAIQKPHIMVPLAFAEGLLMGLAGLAMTLSFVAGIPIHMKDPLYLNAFKNRVARGFIELGRGVLLNPVAGAARVGGLILGPIGTAKLVRVLAAKANPWYVPNTGIRFTFTTGKLSTRTGDIATAIKVGKLTEVQVANAIARATSRAMKNPSATATARLGNTNIRVHIDPTPGAKALGSALWRAVPSKVEYKGLEHIVSVKGMEPAEFYSYFAAPRFALMSAKGVPATSPALIMLYTRAGQLRAYPTSVQYANSLAQMARTGFQYLGSGRAQPGAYGPIKTYLGRFELEAMLPNGMRIYRVPNLRSRIFGAGVGEFVTTVDGWVLPIFRFAERGAMIPKIGLADLAALRVLSVAHGLKVLLGRKGFSSEAGYVQIRTLVKTFESVGRAAVKGQVGALGRTAYEQAIDRAMVERLEVLYRDADPAALEAAWRHDPQRFEGAYIENLARLKARISGYRVDPRAVRPDSSYISVRTTYDREGLIRRAAEFDRELMRVVTGRALRRGEAVRRPPLRELLRVERSLREVTRPPMRRVARVKRRVDRPTRRTERIERPRLRRVDRPERPDRKRPEKIYRPERPERPEIPRIPGRPKIPPILLATKRGKRDTRIPDGAITWRQGIFWKYIPPPYDMKKPITLPKNTPPIGAKHTDLRTPEETIQMIGKTAAPVPAHISVDKGIVDIFVEGGGTRIRFVGGGRKTNVGTRMASPTKGMAIPEAASPTAVIATRKPSGRDAPDNTAFIDETDEFWSRFEHEPTVASKVVKQRPQRTRRANEPPPQMRGIA